MQVREDGGRVWEGDDLLVKFWKNIRSWLGKEGLC